MRKHKKPNAISVSILVLGLSVVLSAFLLISTRIHANYEARIQNEITEVVTPQALSTGITTSPTATATDEIIYTFANSRRLYPVLTWSIAMALILVVGIAIIRNHRKSSRTAVIAVLYLLSAVLLTKSAAISYITTHNPASTNNINNTNSTNNTTNTTNTTETYIPGLTHHHTSL